MSEILNREKIYEWEMRPYGYATGVECGIYPHELEQLYDSHEALRKRVEELERVAFLARAFQDDSTLETTASIDLSVELGAALRALEASDE